jgi:SAM-dependent methyltransferase
MTPGVERAPFTAASEVIRHSEGLDRSSMSVLSLGCGEQDRLDLLLASGFRVAGMDIDAATVVACSERIARIGRDTVELRHGDLSRLPWPDQTFDFVVSEHVLSNLAPTHTEGVLREVQRVLRPNGAFVARVRVGSAREGVAQSAGSGVDSMGEVSVVVTGQQFTTSFGAAFEEVFHDRFAHDARAAPGALRCRVSGVLAELGYRPRDDAVLLVVPRHRHEDRLIPLLIHGRDTESDPLVQYDIRGGVVTLRVFGPLRQDRRSPCARFEVDFNGCLPAIDEEIVRSGVRAVYGGIAVGVHAMERMLRSVDLRAHRSTSLPSEAAARLEMLVAQAIRRCDLTDMLFRALSPISMYVADDCYEEAVDVNVALTLRAPVLVQPKGKAFQRYGPEDSAGRWMPDGRIFRSHLNQRFSKEVATRWSAMDPTFVDDARSLMERRMGSLSALPYMRNVWYRDRESNASVGWRNFRDALGVPVYEPGHAANGSRVAWILSLHSFADEPFRWGMDGLWSLYEMFLVTALHVRDKFPSDLVVLRPHPNSLSLFGNQQLIEQVESGVVRGPTSVLDIYLQLRLCQEIAALGVDCELSSLQPAEELLRPERSIVVTRHGSIMIEASWIDRPGVFSRIAPYAFLYPEEQQYGDADSLHAAMAFVRGRVIAGTAASLSREDIAKYQAVLDSPMGVKRVSAMGEVPFPTSAHHPMRNFDDFRYGPESVAQAADRLLSCLSAPVERAALEAALGRVRSEG